MYQINSKTYRCAANRKQIRELYKSAFPKEERLPWPIMRMLACQKCVNITAYYDHDTFCGFTYDVCVGDMVFIMFFAVEESSRGKGFGSAILSYLKEQNPGKTILLNIEPLDEQSDNYGQRLSRYHFYQKNGFFDTGYLINEVGGTFTVMSTDPHLDTSAYQTVFTSISFGLWKPQIFR